ncbi:MDR family MFS transporter [Aestuariivirga litoralis]|uniref:MDR family MFS transporter n=1 Tax=Aestuariivirga litoralis TaxID=2650924 RepID=UPI0018C458E2|nr:MDR family MFS transporter [Aestuariivirga litoralis]MBG1231157.1 MFS transporter [Aestuariivirga litoralis]
MDSSPAPASPTLSHPEVLRIIFGVIVAMILATLDQTIVVTALPTIGRNLGNPEYLPWVVTAYLLSSTAVTPLYGKVSDIVGRRKTLLFAITVFILGSLACALSPNLLILIIARAVQGLGGGGLISLAQTIIADIVSPKERARYMVYISGVYMFASISGPLLGGYMAQHLHWSLIFWINLPIGLLALAMTNGLLKKLPRHEKPHKLDFLGAALMAAASIALMLALSWGGIHYPWISVQVLGLLAGSVALWAAFIWRLSVAPEPFIPSEILKNRVVAMGTVTALLIMGTYIGITAYLPIYMELNFGLSASQSGLSLIPFMSGTVVGAVIAGRFMAHAVNYKMPATVGLVFSVVGLGLIAAFKHNLGLAVVEVLMAGLSIGLGTVFPITTVSIQNAVSPHQMGTATGVMGFFRSLGGALIVALFGAVLFSQLPDIASLETGGTKLAAMGADEIHMAFRPLFALAAFVLAIALIAFQQMPQKALRTSVRVSDAVSIE